MAGNNAHGGPGPHTTHEVDPNAQDLNSPTLSRYCVALIFKSVEIRSIQRAIDCGRPFMVGWRNIASDM